MVVRQTWRTKSPNFQFLCVLFTLVRQKNLTDVPSDLLLVRQKSPFDRPKTHLMARPSHAILKTNALQCRGRSFIDDIGWAAQWSDIGMAENFSIQQREQIMPLSLRGGTPVVQLQRSTTSRWLGLHHLTLLSPFSCHIGAYLVALMCDL